MVVPLRLRKALLLILAKGRVPVAPESQVRLPPAGDKNEYVGVGEQYNVLLRLRRVIERHRRFILAGVFALIGLLVVAVIGLLVVAAIATWFAMSIIPGMPTETLTSATTTPITTIPTTTTPTTTVPTTKPTTAKPTTTKAATHYLLNTSREWNGYTYQLIAVDVSWHEAENECIKLGSHLVSIHSKIEHEVINELHSQPTCDDRKCVNGDCRPIDKCNRWKYWVWIGLSKNEHSGDFFWSDSTEFTEGSFEAWDKNTDPQQPTIGQDENCAIQSDYDGGWYNIPCSGRFGFICKGKS